MVNKKTKKRRVNINGRNDTKKRRGAINRKITKKKSYQRLKKTQKGGWPWSKILTFKLYDDKGQVNNKKFETMLNVLYELISDRYKGFTLTYQFSEKNDLKFTIPKPTPASNSNLPNFPTNNHKYVGPVTIDSNPMINGNKSINVIQEDGSLFLYCNRCKYKKENKKYVFIVDIFYILVTKNFIYELPAYITIPMNNKPEGMVSIETLTERLKVLNHPVVIEAINTSRADYNQRDHICILKILSSPNYKHISNFYCKPNFSRGIMYIYKNEEYLEPNLKTSPQHHQQQDVWPNHTIVKNNEAVPKYNFLDNSTNTNNNNNNNTNTNNTNNNNNTNTNKKIFSENNNYILGYYINAEKKNKQNHVTTRYRDIYYFERKKKTDNDYIITSVVFVNE